MAESLATTSSRKKKHPMTELMYLSRSWKEGEPPLYSAWMASSEVDQKFLGHFAKTTTADNNYLSRYGALSAHGKARGLMFCSFLFKVLGLSVILAEKLLIARRTKKLDPVRDPKAKHLIHHICE